VTTKILLKFFISKKFVKRKSDLDGIKSSAVSGDTATVFEKFESFSSFDTIEVVRENDFENSIKQFDPLVIQDLRLFSKSPAKLQGKILDMLCQLMEFNVDYMQLDAKKVSVDLVLRQFEYIEGGLDDLCDETERQKVDHDSKDHRRPFGGHNSACQGRWS
jgi:hypothetical protein